MSRYVTAFAFLAMLFPASHLFSIEVCLVNDSDRTAIVTMIAGTERYERRLKPRTHAFVLIADTKDDRVIIAQTVDESSPDKPIASTKVVDTKVIAENVNRLELLLRTWNRSRWSSNGPTCIRLLRYCPATVG